MPAFTPEYRQLKARLAQGIRDDGPLYGPLERQINEEIVRCLWFGLHFDLNELRTVDGRRLEPLSPGWWSVEPGPDFKRAEILMEGPGRLIGDVEVHVRASDWGRHGHAANPLYGNVVLHVVLWNDLEDAVVTGPDGRAIPQLALFEYVKDEMPELIEAMEGHQEDAATAPGGRYCAEHGAQLDPDWMRFLLDVAGDERVMAKAERVAQQFARQPREQVLYEGLMDALGFKNNRLAFQQLARLAPVKLIQEVLPADAGEEERADALQALLYGAAGLLPAVGAADLDDASRERVERLRGKWAALSGALAGAPMSPAHWKFAGTRPWNYPTRRIAAVARLYARPRGHGLFGDLLRTVQAFSLDETAKPGKQIRALARFFSDAEDAYWSTRCRFEGVPLSKPVRLIGAERAAAILVNVATPMLLGHARSQKDEDLEQRLHRLYGAVPALPGNAITRRMGSLFFPSAEAEKANVRSARRQQGLHQIYADFCGRDDSGCETCVIRLQLLRKP